MLVTDPKIPCRLGQGAGIVNGLEQIDLCRSHSRVLREFDSKSNDRISAAHRSVLSCKSKTSPQAWKDLWCCLERRAPNQIQAIRRQQESRARIGIRRFLADLPDLKDAVIAGRFPALKDLIVSGALANGCVE